MGQPAEVALRRRVPHSKHFCLPCRYPSFVDALRDLDDPLTMVHLFATLPAQHLVGIASKVVEVRAPSGRAPPSQHAACRAQTCVAIVCIR